MLSKDVKIECVSHLINRIQQNNEELQKCMADMLEALKEQDLMLVLGRGTAMYLECNALQSSIDAICAIESL